MGTSVWYLIASLLPILVNGETSDTSQSASEHTGFSNPAPGRRLTEMKELVLFLTPDQAKVLEDAGAIVRPFPQFENAFLQQTFQQNIEEHTESQYQPTSTEGDVRRGVEHLDEFYKVINIQQLNEDLTVAAQNVGESTEKPRPKHKYVPKSRQQEYGTTYVQKKNNKTKSYSTEYVRYLPNFEIEDFTIEPYRAQPIPGYYYQDIVSNSELPTYSNDDLLKVQKSEEIQVQQTQENQRPFDIQTQEENQKPIEIQKLEEVQPQQEIHHSQDIQRPLNIQRFEYVQKSKQPIPVPVLQKIEEVQQQSNNRQRFEYKENSKRPVKILKVEEVQPQEDTNKPQNVQRPNIQRLEFIKKPKRPVEIQKLEEVQPQQEVYRPLDIQRQRNIQRLKYIQKSRRPLEVQKLEEVQRNEDIQRPVEIQIPYKPVEIQKHEEVQSDEDTQRPVENPRPYRPVEIQKHEEVQRNEDIQRPVEIQRPYRPVKTQKHGEVQRNEDIQRPKENQTPYTPVEIQKHEEVQRNEDIQRPVEIQRPYRPVEIQKHEEVQRNEDIQRPVEIQRPYRPVEIQKPEEVQNYEEIQRPLEIHTSYRPLELQGHEEIQKSENIQPYIEISTRTPVTEQVRIQEPVKSVESIQPSLNDKGPVKFERKPQILAITRESATVAQSDDIQTSSEFQTSLEDQADVNTESLAEELVEETPSTPSVSVQTATINDQYSSLLAPLVQHEKITESIAQQTELVKSERVIQNKLQQLKDSGSVDGNKFKAEFDKLNKNLDKQNALAEKFAVESISKKQKPQISPKENLGLKSPLEIEGRVEIPVRTPGLLRVPPHLEFRVPRPYPVPFGIVRPIPVPVLQPDIADLEKPVPIEREQLIPVPETRNIFAEFPFLVQGNDELPANYPIHQSDKLAVIRHIWDH